MRFVKIGLGIFGLLLLVLVGAAIAVPLLFEPNDFKPQIEKAVQQQTGRQLRIAGDIELKVFPWLAVDMGATTFANGEGFGDEPMAEIQNVKASIKLLPLLRKNIEIGTLTLDGLVLRLARDSAGNTNWQSIVKQQDAAQKEPKPKQESDGFELGSLTVAGLNVNDSRVYWRDAQAGTSYQAENVKLRTGAVTLGEPIDLELSFTAESSQPAVASEIALEGRVVYDLDKQQYAAENLELTASAAGEGIPVTLKQLKLSGEVNADMQTQQIQLSALQLEARGSGNAAAAQGGIPLNEFVAKLSGELSADLQTQRYSASSLKFNAKGDGAAGLPLQNFAAEGSGELSADMAKQTVNIAGLQLTAEGKGQPDFPLASFNASANTGAINLADMQQLRGDGLSVTLSGKGQGELPIKQFEASLNGLLGMDLTTQAVTLSNAVIQAKGTGTKDGPAQNFDATVKGDITADLKQQRYAINGLALQGKAKGEKLPGGDIDASLSGKLAADLQQQTASLNDLVLAVMGVRASGQIAASQLQSTPQLSGTIRTNTFNPRELVNKLNIELPPMAGPALQSASVSTQLAGSLNNVELKQLQLRFDETTASGELAIADFAAPAVRFNLAIDQLNADRYLPPKSAAASKKPADQTPSEKKEINETPVDLAFLEPLKIAGKATIGKLKINDLEFSNITTGIDANGGLVALNPLALNLYGGSLSGNLGVDVRGGKQKITAKQQLKNLQFEPFTRALMDDAKVAGSGDLSLDLTSSGNTVGELRRQLNGTIDVGVDNGAVLGVNIAQFLRKAKAKLTGDAALAASAAETRSTDFAKITASARIVDGVLTNPDLLGMSPALRLLGEGQVNLVAETLDYKTKITIVETSKGQGGDSLEELRGFAIPVKITGTFSDPKIGLDMRDVLKAALASKIDLEAEKAKLQAKLDAEKQRLKERQAEEQAKLQAKLDEEKQRLQNKLNDKLGGQLGGALGAKLNGGEQTDENGEPTETVQDKASKELERGLNKLFGR